MKPRSLEDISAEKVAKLLVKANGVGFIDTIVDHSAGVDFPRSLRDNVLKHAKKREAVVKNCLDGLGYIEHQRRSAMLANTTSDLRTNMDINEDCECVCYGSTLGHYSTRHDGSPLTLLRQNGCDVSAWVGPSTSSFAVFLSSDILQSPAAEFYAGLSSALEAEANRILSPGFVARSGFTKERCYSTRNSLLSMKDSIGLFLKNEIQPHKPKSSFRTNLERIEHRQNAGQERGIFSRLFSCFASRHL